MDSLFEVSALFRPPLNPDKYISALQQYFIISDWKQTESTNTISCHPSIKELIEIVYHFPHVWLFFNYF